MKHNLKENRVDNSTISVKHISEVSKRIPMNEIWPCEEYNFTPWLRDNIKELSNVLGVDLEVIDIEQRAGRYELDIYAKDIYDGSFYAIENQFGESDNTHVGKAPMYAAILDAQNVVWIGEKMLPEHKKYYEWLNDHSNAENNFYGVEVHCFDIDGTKAYEFEVVVKPNNMVKRANAIKAASTISESSLKAYNSKEAFWNSFKMKANHPADHFRADERTYAYGWYNEDIKNCGKLVTVISTKQKTVTIGFQTDNVEENGEEIENYIKENNISGFTNIHLGAKNKNWKFWDCPFSYNEDPSEVVDAVVEAYNNYVEQFKNLK